MLLLAFWPQVLSLFLFFVSPGGLLSVRFDSIRLISLIGSPPLSLPHGSSTPPHGTERNSTELNGTRRRRPPAHQGTNSEQGTRNERRAGRRLAGRQSDSCPLSARRSHQADAAKWMRVRVVHAGRRQGRRVQRSTGRIGSDCRCVACDRHSVAVQCASSISRSRPLSAAQTASRRRSALSAHTPHDTSTPAPISRATAPPPPPPTGTARRLSLWSRCHCDGPLRRL